MKASIPRIKFLFLLIFFFLNSCKQENADNSLKVRIVSDPESLNPVTFKSKTTRQIFDLVYQTLFAFTLPDGKFEPVLAKSIPVINVLDSGYYTTVELKSDAKWSDGSDVTAHDVAFSVKLLNLPDGEEIGITNPTNFIEKIVINHRKTITFKFNGNSPSLLEKFDDVYIYSEASFDPKKTLRNYTLDELRHSGLSSDVASLSQSIATLNFLENRKKISGSHAYEITAWYPGNQVILERKENFWFKNRDEYYLMANPPKIIFQVIPNSYSAIIALENQQLDVLDHISPLEFEKLRADTELSKSYSFYQAGTYGLTFLGLNGKNPTLKNKHFRQAISYGIPYKDIIDIALKGAGKRTIGFIPPHQEEYYNDEVAPKTFNPDSAFIFFKKAGWELKNDQLTKGQNTLRLEIIYNQSSKDHETASLLIKDALEDMGIEVDLNPLDNNVLKQRLKDQDFDIFINSLYGGPNATNYEYILHTSFVPPRGLNYTSFGNKVSDSLIHKINVTSNDQKRRELLFKFQEIFYDECNVIPLYNEMNNIAIHKKFENIRISNLKPGYVLASFKPKNL